jgi:hypothetical protein
MGFIGRFGTYKFLKPAIMKCLKIIQTAPYPSKYTNIGIEIKIPVPNEEHKFELYNIYDVSFIHENVNQPALALHISDGNTTPISGIDANLHFLLKKPFPKLIQEQTYVHLNHQQGI